MGLTEMKLEEIHGLVKELIKKHVGGADVYSFAILNDDTLVVKVYQEALERVIEWVIKARLNQDGKLEILEMR